MIAAIVVSFNGESFLEECLNSLQNDSEVDLIIVVDNKSSDKSLSIIRENFQSVHLVALERNLGFGQANNIGIELAMDHGADYFLLINQDAYIEPGGVSKLVAIQKNNKEFGIIAPLQLNGKGNNIDIKFYEYLFYQNKSIGYDLYSGIIKDLYSVDFVNAAAWLVSRECILKVGGFDPVFFHTGEDDDYVQRIKYWGFKIGISLKIYVRHDRPQISWVAQKRTLGRQKTLDILGVKNINNSISANMRLYLRKRFYYILYDLFKFRLSATKLKVLSLFYTFIVLPTIKRSREMSLKEYAFLKRR
jgi:GT2 family glycosyltransferase